MKGYGVVERKIRVHETGVALIFALLLLLVLTVIGVGTLNSVRMQERMAGNANLQSLAFLGASAAITETLEWGFDTDNWAKDGDGNPRPCRRGSGPDDRWIGAWSTPETLAVPGIPAGFSVRYQQRVGCFEDPGWTLLTGIDPDDVPQQLLALGRGEVLRTSDSQVVATREIEVRLEDRGVNNPTCLIQSGPLSIVDIRMPNSNVFQIDARPAGCPIQTSDAASAAEMRRQLAAGGDRTGNYLPTNPGITSGPLDGAWGDPVALARATNALKVGIRGFQLWPSTSGANAFAACAGRLQVGNQDWRNNNSCGGTVVNGITYVAGNLSVQGNCEINGQIIVEGGYYSNGTPAYTGDLLILGGEIDIRGFGRADNSGLVILQDLGARIASQSAQVAYDPDNVGFGSGRFRINGGGNATIRPLECTVMQANWDRLNACLDSLEAMVATPSTVLDPLGNFYANLFDQYRGEVPGLSVLDNLDLLRPGESAGAVRFPRPRCDGDAGVGTRTAIASWREFIDQGRWGTN